MEEKNYEPVIGMEVHTELKTKTKMFCSCPNDPFESEINKNVCPICLGHPGVLPTINKKAVEMVIKVGKALNCQIAEVSKFDRKNYFYPDLPKGYQISQYDLPLAFNGYLIVKEKKVRIRRVHLEEDAGKLIHPEGKDYSLVDFNRSGVPLLELVSEPDISSSKEAKEFCQELQKLFRYLEVSDADIEKGQMRCEVNISLRKKGKGEFGQKAEIKNLGSFRSVEEAIDYEIKRQISLLEKGEKIVQETRGWNSQKKITFSQRTKEESSDYRYFPEPDLPLMETKDLDLERIFAEIPELPWQKRERFKKQYPQLTEKEIEVLVGDRFGAEFFEESLSEAKGCLISYNQKEKDPTKTLANFLLTDLRSLLIERHIGFKEINLSPKNFGCLIAEFLRGRFSSRLTKDLLKELFISGKDLEDLIKEKDVSLITGEEEIEKLVRKVIKENPKPVEDYKNGKESAIQFLIGRLMAETKGKIEPKKGKEVLERILKN